jgi:hypothetical protein
MQKLWRRPGVGPRPGNAVSHDVPKCPIGKDTIFRNADLAAPNVHRDETLHIGTSAPSTEIRRGWDIAMCGCDSAGFGKGEMEVSRGELLMARTFSCFVGRAKIVHMRNARETIEHTFPEIRWRTISLAADLDRIERGDGGKELLRGDARVAKLREALKVLIEGSDNRAEQIEMIFSDVTPPPPHKGQKPR